MPLTVESPVPILLFGERDQMQGEIWLSNSTPSDIGLNGGTVLVNFGTPESGAITLPSNTAVPANTTRRLALNMAISPVTPPGVYTATVSLDTAVGPLNTAATAIVAGAVVPALGPAKFTFTGVAPSSVHTATIVVRNRGNTSFTVNAIPDETLVEVVVAPRVLEVGTTGAVTVEPAPGVTPSGLVTFTNPTPTINPGDWAQVDVQITAPASMTADRHFRVMPRIVTERFIVDLLT
jgi:hypothetical protein